MAAETKETSGTRFIGREIATTCQHLVAGLALVDCSSPLEVGLDAKSTYGFAVIDAGKASKLGTAGKTQHIFAMHECTVTESHE